MNNQPAVKKFLVIRFSSIGDIVLTTPVIRCLKTAFPDAEIHYLVKKQFQPLLASNPYLSKLWLYEDNFHELIPRLKKENFDHIIDLHKNFRSLCVRMRLLRTASSFHKLNLHKWLIVNFRINILPGIHLVDRYFRAVERMNVKNDGKGLDYFIPDGEEIDLATIPFSLQQGYIVFVIGGKHTTKILPWDKVAYLCKEIGKPVILLGGMEDMERGERIAGLAGERVYNACGKYSINQSASLVRQAEKVITNDTGLMHIAAAFSKPVLSVWGNTIPGFGMFPYFPAGSDRYSKIFEVKGLSCRPCSKIGFSDCPKKHFRCMNDQDINSIVKAGKETF
jgi:ADP-heptose:LPS heptosyltransferase